MSESRTRVDLSDHVTTVRVNGSPTGAPVVFVHAALLDQNMWQPIKRELAAVEELDLQLITYDLRDHGLATSSASLRNIAQLATDLHDLIAALGVGPVHLVGVSLGGVVAQHMAATHPDLVQSMVLVATAANFPFDPFISRANAMRREGQSVCIEETMSRWFTPKSDTATDHVRLYALERLRSVSEDQWMRTWQVFAGYSVPKPAHPYSKPVLAVAGTRDTSTPPSVMENLRERYPKFDLVTVEAAAHLIPMDSTHLLTHVMAQHFKDIASRP